MNKKIIVSFLIILLILSFFTFKIYATENSNAENSANNEIQSQSNEEVNNSADTSGNNVTYTPQSYSGGNSSYITSVTPVSSQYEANLGLNNILSILLISIGILLILFSVAILIRIKK